MPVLSVVVPMYRVQTYLPDTLQSLQQQSLDDIQIVLVDDDSPDDVASIAHNAASGDSRIVYVHQSNRGPGPGGGRNGGLAAATGDYLLFVDGDDVIAPTMAEKMIDAIRETDADMATCGAVRLIGGTIRLSDFHELGHRRNVAATTAVQSPWLMYDTTPWNKVFARSFFDSELQRWPERVLYEDIALMTRAQLRSARTAVVADPLYYWRIRPSGQITEGTTSIGGDRVHLEQLVAAVNEVRMHGDQSLLDWFSWKAYTYDLTWMARKVGRLNTRNSKALALAMTDAMDELSPGAFELLPPRTRIALEGVMQYSSPRSRMTLVATSWKLRPFARPLDTTLEDPAAEVVETYASATKVRITVNVPVAAGDWALEFDEVPWFADPGRAAALQVAGTRSGKRRRGRDSVVFEIDNASLRPLGDVIHLAVRSACGTWRGELSGRTRNRIARRIGIGDRPAGGHAIVPFFDGNRLVLAQPGLTSLVSVSSSQSSFTVELTAEMAALIDRVGLYSDKQHEPFELTQVDEASWTIPLETIEQAFAAGHQILSLAAGQHVSPSVPLALCITTHSDITDLLRVGPAQHAQVTIRRRRFKLR